MQQDHTTESSSHDSPSVFALSTALVASTLLPSLPRCLLRSASRPVCQSSHSSRANKACACSARECNSDISCVFPSCVQLAGRVSRQLWGHGSAELPRRHALRKAHAPSRTDWRTRRTAVSDRLGLVQVRQNYGVTIDKGFKATSNARLAATFQETKRFADALRKFDKQCSGHLQSVKGARLRWR